MVSGTSSGAATWSGGPMSSAMDQPPDVIVGDADVTGIRVVARRPSRP
jgi:hypothetical protein